MQQELIENGFSVLIPTRPGYQGTPITSGKTAESTADLFAALLEKLEIKKVIVIGNSAGGPAALEFAKRYPIIVEKLILEAAVVKPWFHKLTYQYYGAKVVFHPRRQRKFWQNLTNKVIAHPEKTLIDTIKLFTKLDPRTVVDRMSAKDIERLKKAMITGNDSGEGFMHDVEHRAKNIDQITCPTLIIHSKNDASVPFSHAEYAHKMIENSVLFKAPTDSHFIYLGPGSEKVLEKRMTFIKTE
jgi:pimeloyl-ACP methyl ester carboxylesterase